MELSITRLGVMLAGRRVLDGVSATLRPGRITAILGPNGAGKSTLVKAAAGLIPVDHGEVMLGGGDVTALDPRERARAIGYLPQDSTIHWNVTVADVVALGRLPHRAPFAAVSPSDRAAVDGALVATGITALGDRLVNTLSGGERARVLLARVLAGEPDWLLADEPLASLDPAHQLDMLDRLADVAQRGRGVVIVLHDLLHAGRVADDILLLKDGRLFASGPVRGVLTVANLRAVFDIEVSIGTDASGRTVCVPIGRVPR